MMCRYPVLHVVQHKSIKQLVKSLKQLVKSLKQLVKSLKQLVKSLKQLVTILKQLDTKDLILTLKLRLHMHAVQLHIIQQVILYKWDLFR